MIIKASQRSGASQLGSHLLKPENEHVEIHEIRGFASDNLVGAMKEAQAVAKGTRCKQFLFSVSLNPPENESVPVAAFEVAIERVEQANGLAGHPRMIVFHEKEGRRHAHAVWSRIDPETMTARRMSHFKMKLRDLSKALYLEHGWQMPRGLMDSKERDPRNFSLAEWQQAKRMGRDPGKLKSTVQECWAVAKDRASFAAALESRGLYLAKGDRRGHAVVTYEGEVLSVARLTGVRTKGITAKLGKSDDLKSVAETREHISRVVAPRLRELIAVADRAKAKELAPLHDRRMAMRDQHSADRQHLDENQKARAQSESKLRASRLRHGVAGLWDRVTGQHGRTNKQNEAEAFAAYRRDRGQRDALVTDQLKERRTLQREIVAVHHRHVGRINELHGDLSRQSRSQEPERDSSRDAFNDAASGKTSALPPTRPSQVMRGRENQRSGPDLGR